MDSPDPIHGLSVAVTAFNSLRTVERAIRSVQGLADHVVVVDSGSTDGTVEACRALGAEVVDHPYEGNVKQKQFAIDRCGDAAWVLLLDSDESLEPELRGSIRAVLDENDPTCDGWEVNRKVWFLGGWLNHTYQPEWRLRLARGDRVRVGGENPHDRLEVPGRVRRLAGVLRHDSWASVGDLAGRQIGYARQAAAAATSGGTPLHLLVNPPAAMFKQYVLKLGFRDGIRGLIAAGLTYNATMLKHAFIAARRLRGTIDEEDA